MFEYLDKTKHIKFEISDVDLFLSDNDTLIGLFAARNLSHSSLNNLVVSISNHALSHV